MTSVTDSILNSVILLSVILILGIIVVGASLQNTRLGGELEYTTLLEEQTDAAAESFLTSTVKGESMRKLLGRAMVELQTNVSIENHTIDLVAESERRLDAIYGKDNYYFRLDPVIRGVNLMFVFDYSPSTQSEIAIIRDNLELIQNEIENFIQSEGSGEEKVSIQVFMLPGSPGRCAEINGLSLRNTQCFELSIVRLGRITNLIIAGFIIKITSNRVNRKHSTLSL